eukprot:GHRQ01026068.1.p3 GENE.GHRQ01026068.1~~GHRQ01026068.1.p3  ORF type:complete len:113 (-),score=53.89 GHRQ01026068.1:605-943(-)
MQCSASYAESKQCLRALTPVRTHPVFTGIVQELSSLVKLTQLVLDHNLLRHLPPVVLLLPALAVLMASSNSITYLPEGLGQMQQLQALLLNSNQLMQVRAEQSCWHGPALHA